MDKLTSTFITIARNMFITRQSISCLDYAKAKYEYS